MTDEIFIPHFAAIAICVEMAISFVLIIVFFLLWAFEKTKREQVEERLTTLKQRNIELLNHAEHWQRKVGIIESDEIDIHDNL